MAELNIEFFTCNLRMLTCIDQYSKKHRLLIPDDPKIEYLVKQALSLIDEINRKPPKFQHPDKTPKDSTEPKIIEKPVLN